MKDPAKVVIVILFVANLAAVAWLQALPRESEVTSIASKALFREETEAETLAEKDATIWLLKAIGSSYVSWYRKHRVAATVVTCVLIADACFVFATGVILCARGQTPEEENAADPPAEAESRAVEE
ncbi:MAG: hypothetical protein ACYTG0_24465 [Planctomycetota bacterium]|jgi:hypothetical protein